MRRSSIGSSGGFQALSGYGSPGAVAPFIVAPTPRGAPAGGIGLPTAMSQSSHCTPLDQGDWATCVANAMVRVVQDVMMLKYNTCIDEKGLRTYTAVAAGAYHLVLIRR